MVFSLPVVEVFRILNQCMRVMNVSKPPLRKIKNRYLYVVSFHLDSIVYERIRFCNKDLQ